MSNSSCTMASLPEQITKDLDGLVQDACADSTSLPCAGAVVVGNGTRWATGLFEHVDGQADVYWLASCTKLVTSIACMQLVEKGVLSLDDADQLERLCPELKDVKVVDENGALTEKRGRITLRMLLSHTGKYSVD